MEEKITTETETVHSPSAIALELTLFSRFLQDGDIRNGNQINDKQIPVINQELPKLKKKDTFLAKIHFIICCIGYSVGLGNIWRFPYLAMVHGGGSFVIAYFIMTIFVGTPLFFLELALGQYARLSPVKLFAYICPIFSGLGPAMMFVTALVMIYYNVLLAWILIYIFSSFNKILPWSVCDPSWCSPGCFTIDQYWECARKNLTLFNGTCYNRFDICNVFSYLFSNISYCNSLDEISFLNATKLNEISENKIPVAVDYYINRILSMSKGIDEVGEMKWQLALALSIAWFLVFACLVRGSYTSGKLIYITALFPWSLLLILLVKGLTLEGSSTGIIYFFKPQLHRFLDFEIWGDAAVQVLFSLGTTFGVLISLASSNHFQNNSLRDAIVVVICDSLTSLIAGVAVFAVLGAMAIDLNVSVEEIVPSGLELIFIIIPQAVTSFFIPPFWSFLFFTMLLTLGLDSQYAAVASFQNALEEVLPSFKAYHIQVLGSICFIGFVLGLPMTTEAGIYIFKLFDKFVINWSVLLIGILECVVVMWMYGNYNDNPIGFAKHIEDMLDCRISRFWIVCWKVIIPIGLSIIIFSQWLTEKTLWFGSYAFPKWAYIFGWLLSLSTLLIVPIIAGYIIVRTQRKKLNMKTLFYPTDKWNSSRTLSNDELSKNAFYNPLDVHKLAYHRTK